MMIFSPFHLKVPPTAETAELTEIFFEITIFMIYPEIFLKVIFFIAI